MLTLNELCDRLKHIDEISLMEVLEINSDEIVDRFVDKIEERMDDLQLDFEAEFDELEE
jgi:ribosome assembly protein YihI (activator of Der GTPase)|tara:strand:+ start:1017 stop:1193 length:177 start_codon:yes stop_codon:yes gene_type:complete